MNRDRAVASGTRPGVRFDACFEAFDRHRSVVVRWSPADAAPRARALFVPAFGDEMNQMRRMVRLAAEALAARGIASCTFDLFGTGDSSADFRDARVEHWLADCRRMAAGTADAGAGLPLVLVGCRLGAALASRVSHELPERLAAFLGWAPVLQGRQQLSAMLRVANVGRMQRPDEAAAPEPKALWAQGRIAMLGGYPFAPGLVEGLERLDGSAAPAARGATLIELRMPVEGAAVTVPEGLAKRAAAWTQAGVPTAAQAVAGPAFWNVADLVDVPALVAATADAVAEALGPQDGGAVS